MLLKTKHFTVASECDNIGTGKQMHRLLHSLLSVKRGEQECEDRYVFSGFVFGITAMSSEVM